MFLGWCAIKNREQRTKKIKKTVKRCSDPKKKSKLGFAQKKNSSLGPGPLGKKNLSSPLGEKGKRENKKNPKIQKSHPQNAKSFFSPCIASPRTHRFIHLKANKDLCVLDRWDNVRTRAGGEKGGEKNTRGEKPPSAKRQVLFAPRVASPCNHQQHFKKGNFPHLLREIFLVGEVGLELVLSDGGCGCIGWM